MNEDIRETLTLLQGILDGIHCGTPARLIGEFLDPSSEDEVMSVSELNGRLDEYMKEFLVTDVDTSARMVRLGNQYLPLNAINKWRTDEKYSYAKHRQEYRIILNESEGKVGMFNNMVASYETEEQRKADIDKLLEMKLSWSQL